MAGGVLYSREVMDRVYDLMSEGMSLAQIGRLPGMPSAKSIRGWIIRFPEEEGLLYARARDLQAEHLAQEIVEIADSDTDPQRARNRIDARKWVAAKLSPRRYGDRVEVEHSGSVAAAAPPVINVLIQAEKGQLPVITGQQAEAEPIRLLGKTSNSLDKLPK